MISVYYHICQYTTIERSDLIFRQTKDLSLPLAYSPPMCTKRRSNCNFAPASRAILATVDYLCPTARRGRLARQSSSSRSHRCSHAKHSTRVATWPLQQFAFHSFMIFHVFSQSLDHVALFHEARDSFTHVASL